MLKERIILTLNFFNLQNTCLTLLELQKYLLAETRDFLPLLTGSWELGTPENFQENIGSGKIVEADEILHCLKNECAGEVEMQLGFYFLKGRENLAKERLRNYTYGLKREKRIRRYARFLAFIPFVRGVALTGSQALGEQKENSDIDLFIITDPKFLWLARTLVTAYFQVLGVRRYGRKVVNRFCLNHYIAGPKILNQHNNLYTAMEYLKLRPLVYGLNIETFRKRNSGWIKTFFPNAEFGEAGEDRGGRVQQVLERLLLNRFGFWLEKSLKSWQEARIKKVKFILVEEDELSFHPRSKQDSLLETFFTQH